VLSFDGLLPKPIVHILCCFKPEELFPNRDFEHSLGTHYGMAERS
jgi:hypothetical protein